MSKIRIKDFGPIHSGFQKDNFFDIKKLTLFVGHQGAGKSSVAKLVSSFEWLEKALLRRDLPSKILSENTVRTSSFFKELFNYHNILSYFSDKTEIDYIGQYCHFTIRGKNLTLENKKTEDSIYEMPKIIYIPSERSFISSVESPETISGIAPALHTFLEESLKAGRNLDGMKFKLPIKNIFLQYNKDKKEFFIMDNNAKYKINLTESASGFQSSSLLSLVSTYLSGCIDKPDFDSKRKMPVELQENVIAKYNKLLSVMGVAASFLGVVLSSSFLIPAGLMAILTAAGISLPPKKNNQSGDERLTSIVKKCFEGVMPLYFFNIVEEPEQNLFPNSQKDVVFHLLECLNKNTNNKLLVTTHSPYVLETFNNCIYAGTLQKRGVDVKNIIALPYQIHYDDVAAYAIKNGSIIDIKRNDLYQIDPAEIDLYSSEINEVYTKLLDADYERTDEKNT